jgi:hypothetical protein
MSSITLAIIHKRRTSRGLTQDPGNPETKTPSYEELISTAAPSRAVRQCSGSGDTANTIT